MSQKSKGTEGKDRRQHQRVALQNDWGEAQALIAAKVIWSNQDRADIFDMSYTGAAVGRSSSLELQPGDTVSLIFEFPEQNNCGVKAQVMWLNEKVAGLRFASLEGQARLAFDQFLQDQLIGANLGPIAKEFFSSQLDCDHWYQGPMDTNVWLWMDKNNPDRVKRAEIELDQRLLIFADGQFQLGASPTLGKSGEDEEGSPQVGSTLERQAPFVQRVMAVLSQIEEQKGPLRRLLNEMVKIPL